MNIPNLWMRMKQQRSDEWGNFRSHVLKPFIEVIKPKQTMLLMITCIVAYLIASSGSIDFIHFIITCLSTTLAIAGTTALNMWLDIDIDALMKRTKNRPLPAGRLSPNACAIYGFILFILGFGIGLLYIHLLFAIILLLGLFFDIVIYTILLKRRSPYSIILGGIAGAMPALAGWVSVKGFDILGGIILALIVLFWIPTHIWYITMYYEEDYRRARIPMYPLVVGMEKASWVIVITIVLMMLMIPLIYILAHLNIYSLVLSILITGYLLCRAIRFAKSPSRERARGMYVLASIILGCIYILMLLGVYLK